MSLFYISDWHYGHKNIIGYDQRPFFSVSEMNDALVQNWNSVVQPTDTVYVLGDMFWCSPTEAVPVLKSLKGTKVLVRGNHDRCSSEEFQKCFAQIADYLEIEDEGRHVILCHYPMVCYKNRLHGWLHLYGHVHISPEAQLIDDAKRRSEAMFKTPCRMYNVGAMLPYMDYTPRTLDEIIRDAEGNN